MDASYLHNICEYKLEKTEIFILAAFLIFKLVPFSITWYQNMHVIVLVMVMWPNQTKHIWTDENR